MNRARGTENHRCLTMSNDPNRAAIHNRYAPFWAAATVVLCLTGLSTSWIDLGAFWKSYVLDITGPAWNYILFRGLFTEWRENSWTRFFTPVRTYTIFILVCFGIETAQGLGWYDSTFDPLDYPAYLSLLTILFMLDFRQSRMQTIK